MTRYGDGSLFRISGMAGVVAPGCHSAIDYVDDTGGNNGGPEHYAIAGPGRNSDSCVRINLNATTLPTSRQKIEEIRHAFVFRIHEVLGGPPWSLSRRR